MTFHKTVLALVAYVILGVSCRPAPPSVNYGKPNFIFILADDLGVGRFKIAMDGLTQDQYDPLMVARDSSKYDIETVSAHAIKSVENLTKLANEGIYFDNAYAASPWCSPSRLSILTGQYPHANGAWISNDIRGGAITENSYFLSQIFKDNGYKTGIVGKWHLGSNKNKGGLKPEQHPHAKGFDEYMGFDHSGTRYFNSKILEKNKEPIKKKGFLTKVFTSEALKFIESSKEEPFFLFLSYNAPHGPLDLVPKKNFLMFGDEKTYNKNNLYGREVTDWSGSSLAHNYNSHIQIMDKSIGQLVGMLKYWGVDKNTIIVFASDHGASGFETTSLPANSPYKGYKGQYYDGSLRVPLFFWSPLFNEESSGRIQNNVMLFDIMPTLLSLAGVKVDASLGLDGKDLSGLLHGSEGDLDRSLTWAGMHTKRQAIDYKDDDGSSNVGVWLHKNETHTLRHTYGVGFELYEASDHLEKNNLASQQNIDIINGMVEEYMAWYNERTQPPPFFKSIYNQVNMDEIQIIN